MRETECKAYYFHKNGTVTDLSWQDTRPHEVFKWKHEGQPVKIAMYSGYLDSTGKGIHEGDVLKDDTGCLLEVKFGKLPLNKSGDCVCTYAAFYCKPYGKLGHSPSYECEHIGEWMTIIGNIHQNPELLES